jgi:hypothetical protein
VRGGWAADSNLYYIKICPIFKSPPGSCICLEP